MKKLMAATAVLALLTGTSAFAQDEHHDRGDRGGPPPHAAPAPQAPRPAPPPQAARPAAPPQQAQGGPGGQRYGGPQGGGAPAYRPQGQQGGPDRGDWHGRGGEQPAYRPQPGPGAGGQGYPGRPSNQGRPNDGFQGDPRDHGGRGPDRGGDRGDFRPGGRPGWGAPGFNPGGRDHPRYDPQYYPRQIHPDERFHWRGDGWRPQRGFYYRRWAYGEYLPFGWFDQSYWVGDYWDYELPVPPYGYQWVRVGPDVLLINLDTGFVAETVYGLFY